MKRIIHVLIKGTIALIVGAVVLTSCGGNSLGNLPGYYVYIDPSVPLQYVDEVIEGGEQWNKHSICPIFIFSTENDPRCNIFVKHKIQPQGVGGEGQKDVGVWIDFTKLDTDKQVVEIVVHELGHVLGLPHFPNPECVMYSDWVDNKLLPFCDEEVGAFIQLTEGYCR